MPEISSVEEFDFLGMRAVVASPRMAEVIALTRRIARTSATVLIQGESGCGKEIIARAIHTFSLRCGKPWVDISCGALPEHLMESELFGFERGAFSGANTPKAGLFELAHTGTLFLDEIGELDPRMQVKLLRVLDGAPYYKLGGTRKTQVDVRVIAATNVDLKQAVEEGQFRGDLYHRLSQLMISVPPVRERPEDIEALARYFLAQQDPSLELEPAGVAALLSHRWPGNVRELRNVMIRAAVQAADGCVGPAELNLAEDLRPRLAVINDLDGLERQTILRVLHETRGHRQRAAERLGISRRTLTRKLKIYRLEDDAEGEPYAIDGRWHTANEVSGKTA